MVPCGSKLAQYELQSELGRGGAGVVHAARDTKLNRDVAVKILNEKTAVDRPLREIQAAAILDHPGIARIYEASEAGGRRFIAMEFVPGSTLDEVLRKGPLPARKAIDYAGQILRALEAAHSRGVVHRDLKPSNIMVTPDGRIKIVDFGLAKVASPLDAAASGATTSLDWSRITVEGSFAGTIAYMSPEQAEGKAVDARADIFSFGAILYEMLTGLRLFARESPVATIVAVMTHQPERPEAVPEAAWPLLERTLRKDPRERWRGAGDLNFALEMAMVREAPATRIENRQSRRRFLWWSAGLGAAAAAGAFVMGKRSVSVAVPRFEQLTFDSGEIMTSRLGLDGSSAYVSFRPAGSEQYEMYELQFGSRGLKKLDLPPSYVEGLSSKGELALVLLNGSPPGVLARAPRQGGPVKPLAGQSYFASWSPDGAELMAARMAGGKYRLEYPLGTVVDEADGARGFPFQYANLSRDGSKIAYFRSEAHSRYEDLQVLDVPRSSGSAPRVLSSGWAQTSPLHWTPNNGEIWFTGARSGRHAGLWSVDMQGREQCLMEAPGLLRLDDIRPTDQAALVASAIETSLIRFSGGGPNVEFAVPGTWLVSISDDGASMMAVEPLPGEGQSHTIFLYAKGNKTPIRMGECQHAALSSDGNFVAAARSRGNEQRLVIMPVGPGDVRDVTRSGFYCQNIRWFADGKRLLVAGNEPGRESQSFMLSLIDDSFVALTPPGTAGLIVSPDGKSLLIQNQAGERSILDLGSGRTQPLHIDRDFVALAWHADGKSILLADRWVSYVGVITIARMDPASGKMSTVQKIKGPGRVLFPVITPDGRHFGYTSVETNSTLYLVHGLK